MSSDFNCSYMAICSLTYIPGFSVSFFQPIYTYYINWAYFNKNITFKSSLKLLNQIWLRYSLGNPLSTMCMIALPSIQVANCY